jgi:hypothetical protein
MGGVECTQCLEDEVTEELEGVGYMVFDGDYENIQLDRVGQGDGVGPRAFSGQKIAHFPFSSTSVMEGSLNCLGWVPRTMKHILALVSRFTAMWVVIVRLLGRYEW